uniref:Uncharacterized protein n=1 Tax=Capra hircus TaxID=9925 RepID=A0A8C2RI92_CAPHI
NGRAHRPGPFCQWGIFRGHVIRGSLIFWLVDSNDDFCVVNQGSFGTGRIGVKSSSFPFCFSCWSGRALVPAPAWTPAALWGWPGTTVTLFLHQFTFLSEKECCRNSLAA